MIYQQPPAEEAVDQGDIIDGCALLQVTSFDPDNVDPLEIGYSANRVVVLTQTCDLANNKTTVVVVGRILAAQSLVDQRVLKAAEVRGAIRAGRVYGLYYLPGSAELGLPEAIVDLRQLHTVRLDLLLALCRKGLRRARIQPLYREHLAKHFADTYSRIGLPAPYDTDP
ncbi:MAG TPA: hypothetical protein VGY66_29275 [Gemmataceae bacterium]|jgi:hypothetical protein|nr:hypothetical protein [Gemmataceae bacterium]